MCGRRKHVIRIQIDHGGKAMSDTPVIVRDPEVLGGTPVFAGTRVPVQTLLDYLGGGQRLDEFLADFPTVHPEQVAATIELLKQLLIRQVYETAA